MLSNTSPMIKKVRAEYRIKLDGQCFIVQHTLTFSFKVIRVVKEHAELDII